MNDTSKGFHAVLLLCLLMSNTLQAQPLCRAINEKIPDMPVFDETLKQDEIRVTAGKSTVKNGNRALFQDNVTAQRNDLTLRADRMAYNAELEEIEAWGNVTLWDKGFVMRSDYAQLFGAKKIGGILDAEYWLPERRGRGRAEKILKHDSERFDLLRFNYTTCDPENESWTLEALETRLDFPNNKGVSKHALLRVRGLPVLYLPYLTYPISDKPKSGFLAPTLGYSNGRGVDATIPYYWRISDQHDLTFSARLMADRGTGFSSEFRYLGKQFGGELYAEYLANDGAEDSDFPGETRYFYQIKHKTSFSPIFHAQLNYADVSDYAYFEDFGDQRDIAPGTVVTTLPSTASLVHGFKGYWWILSVQEQKLILPPPNDKLTTYRHLPRLSFSPGVIKAEKNHAFNWKPDGSLTRFDLDEMENDVRPSGLRLDLNPSFSYPMRWPAGFFVPNLDLRFTAYDLSYPDVAGIEDKSLNRLTTTASADMGLFFEREWLGEGTKSWLQTLEPRAFYQYTPYKDQSEIPIFDTAPLWFMSWGQLFSTERYGSADRVKDEHSIALALSTRIIDQQTGLDRLRAGIGQIYYLADRDVVAIPSLEDDGTADRSAIIADVAAHISARLSAAASVHWNDETQSADYQMFGLRYMASPYKQLNLSYHRLHNAQVQIDQADISFRWPFNRNWRALGRYNYSFEHKLDYETVLGIEYESCCWAIRVMGRRYLQDVAEEEFNSGIYFQVELKGLAGVGNSHFFNNGDFALTVPNANY